MKRDNQTIYHDEWGNEYVLDADGNRRTPSQAARTGDGWLSYDDSRGHCGLCGRLECRGGCFK